MHSRDHDTREKRLARGTVPIEREPARGPAGRRECAGSGRSRNPRLPEDPPPNRCAGTLEQRRSIETARSPHQYVRGVFRDRIAPSRGSRGCAWNIHPDDVGFWRGLVPPCWPVRCQAARNCRHRAMAKCRHRAAASPRPRHQCCNFRRFTQPRTESPVSPCARGHSGHRGHVSKRNRLGRRRSFITMATAAAAGRSPGAPARSQRKRRWPPASVMSPSSAAVRWA